MRNADGWGLAFIVFGTAATVWALPAHTPRNAHSTAKTSVAELPANEVGYKISVVAPRVPSECRALDANSAGDLIARCQAITSGETQMTMRPVDATVQVAEQPR
jgi:hypothetical protein